MPRLAPPTAVLLALFVAILGGEPAAAQQGALFEQSELWVETAAGSRYRFDVELAVTGAQQAQGLMHRDEMAADAGMLFVFEPMRPVSFWMKNTLIPLDMLFVAADGRIVNIAERTTPLSTDSVPSDGPVKAVLEINGGMAALLGIHPGDRVSHAAFGP
ncbi:MAG: DUF192 domain-containing protein [Alphaproteobacteria bacterium]